VIRRRRTDAGVLQPQFKELGEGLGAFESTTTGNGIGPYDKPPLDGGVTFPDASSEGGFDEAGGSGDGGETGGGSSGCGCDVVGSGGSYGLGLAAIALLATGRRRSRRAS
jgi:MYXO-CTERM domain-containing protein